MRSLLRSIKPWFRHYFVRRKSPLSYIWWSDILKRDVSSEGVYNIALATVEPDSAIILSSGAPRDNYLEICVYDSDNKLRHTVEVKLPYRHIKRVKSGFHQAFRLSREILKEEE